MVPLDQTFDVGWSGKRRDVEYFFIAAKTCKNYAAVRSYGFDV